MEMIEDAQEDNIPSAREPQLAPLQETDIRTLDRNAKVWAFMSEAEK